MRWVNKQRHIKDHVRSSYFAHYLYDALINELLNYSMGYDELIFFLFELFHESNEVTCYRGSIFDHHSSKHQKTDFLPSTSRITLLPVSNYQFKLCEIFTGKNIQQREKSKQSKAKNSSTSTRCGETFQRKLLKRDTIC